jgi:predicted dehydrogenase
MASKPHFAALSDLADDGAVRVVSVHTRDAARRRAAAETLHARPVDGVDAIAEDPEVDAVLLLTPPNARQEIVGTLAAAGKPVLRASSSS